MLKPERCVCGHDPFDHVEGDGCVRCECSSFDPTNDNADDDGSMREGDFEDGRRPEIMTLRYPMTGLLRMIAHMRQTPKIPYWAAPILLTPTHTERGHHGHHDEGRC